MLLTLMTTLGVTQREIPHLLRRCVCTSRDIGHNEQDRSVTYEECTRTGAHAGLNGCGEPDRRYVLGTGDLSGIALGCGTYNADHMSMYGVKQRRAENAGALGHSDGYGESGFCGLKGRAAKLILDTPISPEPNCSAGRAGATLPSRRRT